METGPHRSSSAPATCVTPTNERPEIKTDPVVGARHESRGQKPSANLPAGRVGRRTRSAESGVSGFGAKASLLAHPPEFLRCAEGVEKVATASRARNTGIQAVRLLNRPRRKRPPKDSIFRRWLAKILFQHPPPQREMARRSISRHC